MPSLILTLPATSLPSAAPTCAAVWTDDGSTVQRQTEAPLALLKASEGTDTVLVVPAAQLSWHRVDMPRGSLGRSADAPRLRAVLHGILEERLLDEWESLHLALQPQAQDGAPCWVAVCQREWLKAWIEALERAGHGISRIVPECHPVAAGAQTQAWIQGPNDRALVLACTSDGVTLMPLGGQVQTLLGASLGRDCRIQAEPSVVELAEHFFPDQVQLQSHAERVLLAAQGPWDLAQFDLVRTRSTRLRKQLAQAWTNLWSAPHWRPARWAVAALVGIHVIGVQAWAWQERQALAAKRASINSLLTSTFPEVRLVVDAPLQMARALADLQRQNGAAAQTDLETFLSHLHTTAPELPAPTAIEFLSNELRLQETGVTPQTLAALNQRLQPLGYVARVEAQDLVLRAQERR